MIIIFSEEAANIDIIITIEHMQKIVNTPNLTLSLILNKKTIHLNQNNVKAEQTTQKQMLFKWMG